MHHRGENSKPSRKLPSVMLALLGVLTLYFGGSILNGVVGHSKTSSILADLEITATPLDSRLTEDRMLFRITTPICLSNPQRTTPTCSRASRPDTACGRARGEGGEPRWGLDRQLSVAYIPRCMSLRVGNARLGAKFMVCNADAVAQVDWAGPRW